jgi:hypothetical protein
LYAFLLASIRATCPVHIVLLNFFVLITENLVRSKSRISNCILLLLLYYRSAPSSNTNNIRSSQRRKLNCRSVQNGGIIIICTI